VTIHGLTISSDSKAINEIAECRSKIVERIKASTSEVYQIDKNALGPARKNSGDAEAEISDTDKAKIE
jgi:hypothetical protein